MEFEFGGNLMEKGNEMKCGKLEWASVDKDLTLVRIK